LQSKPNSDPVPALRSLAKASIGERFVVGIGASLVAQLGITVPGLKTHPNWQNQGISLPSTPAALWLWIRASDAGKAFLIKQELLSLLATGFEVEREIDAFFHDGGKDLTGYEDGTENPTGEKAQETAVVGSTVPGMSGSSFVAVEQWFHHWPTFRAWSQEEQDAVIGRERNTNEELEDAPSSAHVKLTAQEDFDPQAFLVRRSMPWANQAGEGLVFVAFGSSFDSFEAQLQRMLGLEDGIQDALFRFTRPRTGSYFWCPPTCDDHLDLQTLNIT
jgi:porphyrinogen peroxidase